MTLFENYKKHKGAKISPVLLWEYDLTKFDYQDMKILVVQRVVEMGKISDWYAILNLYGWDDVMQTIRDIPSLSNCNLNFVHVIFDIPLKELKCYKNKQSRPTHWN